MGFMKRFKDFALRGNVIDMAVGVIIGGAFGKIVTSLVNDVIMPPIGRMLGGVNFADLKYVLAPATEEAAEVAIKYGNFIQTVVDFLIVALCIFCFISAIQALSERVNAKKIAEEKARKEAEAAEAAAKPTTESLLCEIRDLLKEKKDQ